jgi:hypothetical protein
MGNISRVCWEKPTWILVVCNSDKRRSPRPDTETWELEAGFHDIDERTAERAVFANAAVCTSTSSGCIELGLDSGIQLVRKCASQFGLEDISTTVSELGRCKDTICA